VAVARPSQGSPTDFKKSIGIDIFDYSKQFEEQRQKKQG
jgi:hypothetical protein